jgi:hypothetical protein
MTEFRKQLILFYQKRNDDKGFIISEIGFVIIIQKLVAEEGKDIFLETIEVIPLSLELTRNEFKKEVTFLLAILGTDSDKYINMAENIADCKRSLVKRLEDDYGLSPQKTGEMLDLLFFVLQGIKPQSSDSLETDFDDIIKKLVKERGKDIFIDTETIKNLLRDYKKNEYQKETTLLLNILDIDSVQYINVAENLADYKQSLVKLLKDDYNLFSQKTVDMLDSLFHVLKDETVVAFEDNEYWQNK